MFDIEEDKILNFNINVVLNWKLELKYIEQSQAAVGLIAFLLNLFDTFLYIYASSQYNYVFFCFFFAVQLKGTI